MKFQKTGKDIDAVQGLKRIVAKFVGGDEDPQEVLIGPGTTTADLLRKVNRDPSAYFLSNGRGDSIFGPDENIYTSLQDGDLVYVASQIEAGYAK